MRALAATLGALVLGCADYTATAAKPEASSQIGEGFGTTVTLSGTIFDYAFGPASAIKLRGVSVCQETPTRCTESLADGTWSLAGLEPEREILLTYEKAGYLSVVQPLVTPAFSSSMGDLVLTPHDVALVSPFNAARDRAGLEALGDSHLASISFNALFDGNKTVMASLHVRLEPDLNIDPLYLLYPSYEAASEVPKGGDGVYGIFLDVPPSEEYALVYTMDEGECMRLENVLGGWPDRDGRTNVTRVLARTDVVTYLTAQLCERDQAP